MTKLLLTTLLVIPLLAESISTTTVDKFLEYKKTKYIQSYEASTIKRPQKESYPVEKTLSKGSFEKTPAFNKRVDKERLRVQKKIVQIDKVYDKSVQKYENDLVKQASKMKKAKADLPKVLARSLNGILNSYLGKPTIKAFVNNDVSSYNADNEAFVTTISSKGLSIDVEVQVPVAQAQKLYNSKKLKQLKPEIKLEYMQGDLYIHEIVVKYKKQKFNVAISGLKNYNTSFKLNHTVADTIIVWKEDSPKDKDVVAFNKTLVKKPAKKIALKEPFQNKAQKRYSAVSTSSCFGCHGANFEKKALGKSKVVSNMRSHEIKEALLGYKNGTYGGPMKGLMKAQVARYSESEISSIAQSIGREAMVKSTKRLPYRRKSSLGSVRMGHKLYAKKVKRSCSLSANTIASRHTQDGWKKSYKNGDFKSEMVEMCPNTSIRSWRDKYLPHYAAFFHEYASDSGNVLSE
ncbi:MAG: hypothetical protein JJW00_02590 [Sulfurimonas sp.]|nr:hypothetical protein [Sulfurimonas sp.]